MKLLSILIWLTILGTFAFIDANLNNKKEEKLFGQSLSGDIASLFVKIIIAFLSILVIWYKCDLMIVKTVEPFGVFLIFGGLGWFAFDIIYNIFRKFDVDYVGKTAITDKYFHKFKHPFTVQIIAKGVMILAGIILYKL